MIEFSYPTTAHLRPNPGPEQRRVGRALPRLAIASASTPPASETASESRRDGLSSPLSGRLLRAPSLSPGVSLFPRRPGPYPPIASVSFPLCQILEVNPPSAR
jgi:hypothetical protein